jgi:hypothetical protein
MKYTTSVKDSVELEVSTESDGSGLVSINGIEILRLTTGGKLARIIHDTSVVQSKLKRMGIQLDDSGSIKMV